MSAVAFSFWGQRIRFRHRNPSILMNYTSVRYTISQVGLSTVHWTYCSYQLTHYSFMMLALWSKMVLIFPCQGHNAYMGQLYNYYLCIGHFFPGSTFAVAPLAQTYGHSSVSELAGRSCYVESIDPVRICTALVTYIIEQHTCTLISTTRT